MFMVEGIKELDTPYQGRGRQKQRTAVYGMGSLAKGVGHFPEETGIHSPLHRWRGKGNGGDLITNINSHKKGFVFTGWTKGAANVSIQEGREKRGGTVQR